MSGTISNSMDVGKRIQKLEKKYPKGYDLSLDRMIRLLESLGNPHLRIPPVIHVAGTNAKGSTISFIRNVLEANGLAVHTHTSPHLIKWNERYRIGKNKAKGGGSRFVTDKQLCDAIDEVAKANKGGHITVFEILSAVMFVLFSKNPADVCVVEVGLGGRLDATNVIQSPAVCVITPIGLDHQEWLGETIKKIAREKAGIIKPSSVVVCAKQHKDAKEVVGQKAKKVGAVVRRNKSGEVAIPLPAMKGKHQIENSKVAVRACLAFGEVTGVEIRQAAINKGVKSAEWAGRLQKINKGKLVSKASGEIWVDGGHNPHASKKIAQFFGELGGSKKFYVILGMLNNRNPKEFVKPFRKLNPNIVTVPIVSSDNGFKSDELAKMMSQEGYKVKSAKSLKETFKLLEGAKGIRVLVTGSLYLAGDLLEQNGTKIG